MYTDLSNKFINSVAPNFRLFGFSSNECPKQASFPSKIHQFQIFGCLTFFCCFASFDCFAFFRLFDFFRVFCLYRTFCFFCLFCLFQKRFFVTLWGISLKAIFLRTVSFFLLSQKCIFFMTNEMKNMRLALIQFSYSTQILCTCFFFDAKRNEFFWIMQIFFLLSVN